KVRSWSAETCFAGPPSTAASTELRKDEVARLSRPDATTTFSNRSLLLSSSTSEFRSSSVRDAIASGVFGYGFTTESARFGLTRIFTCASYRAGIIQVTTTITAKIVRKETIINWPCRKHGTTQSRKLGDGSRD